MTATVHGFQTEVTKLLNLLANSLYSNKEVFLRELISNASDAIDKLHFLSLTQADLIKDDPEFKIRVRADKDAKTLTITDNGIGMTLDEANANLGTIAKSGTEEFVKQLSGDQAKDSQLIGQFGVGFYSAFIVADHVTVISRSAKVPAAEGVRWSSDGLGSFESENIEVPTRGTQIILHLKDDGDDFLNTWKLRDVIAKYSDHISVPVELYDVTYEQPEYNAADDAAAADTANADSENANAENADAQKAEGENAAGDSTETENQEPKQPVEKWEYVQVNNAKSLWTRPAKEITDEEYQSFYKHTFDDYVDPMIWSHNKVEGELEYTSLLYIPSRKPMGLMMREPHLGIKLYVQRVFIMDEDEQFLPSYLRFVRGLVDTNALPLNISRELLQDSRVTRKLKSALTKRAFSLIEKLSQDEEKYREFVQNFNDTLKEGVSDQSANQDQLLKLIRFASTFDTDRTNKVSLEDYVKRMKEGQKHIYYLCADEYDKVVNSPYLERLKAKGIEVLLLWNQPIDDWFVSFLRNFQGKVFVSATSEDLDLGDLENEQDKQAAAEAQKSHEDLVKHFKEALGDKVDDVKISSLLTDSPACLVNKNVAMSLQMKMMARMQGMDLPEEKGILELNPNHPLVQKAYAEVEQPAVFKDYADLIFLEAVLSDQGQIKNPSSFVTIMNRLLLGTSADAAVEVVKTDTDTDSSSATDDVVEAQVVEEGKNGDSSVQL